MKRKFMDVKTYDKEAQGGRKKEREKRDKGRKEEREKEGWRGREKEKKEISVCTVLVQEALNLK